MLVQTIVAIHLGGRHYIEEGRPYHPPRDCLLLESNAIPKSCGVLQSIGQGG
jgi:hypothetical protein